MAEILKLRNKFRKKFRENFPTSSKTRCNILILFIFLFSVRKYSKMAETCAKMVKISIFLPLEVVQLCAEGPPLIFLMCLCAHTAAVLSHAAQGLNFFGHVPLKHTSCPKQRLRCQSNPNLLAPMSPIYGDSIPKINQYVPSSTRTARRGGYLWKFGQNPK